MHCIEVIVLVMHCMYWTNDPEVALQEQPGGPVPPQLKVLPPSGKTVAPPLLDKLIYKGTRVEPRSRQIQRWAKHLK